MHSSLAIGAEVFIEMLDGLDAGVGGILPLTIPGIIQVIFAVLCFFRNYVEYHILLIMRGVIGIPGVRKALLDEPDSICQEAMLLRSGKLNAQQEMPCVDDGSICPTHQKCVSATGLD